MAWLCLNFRASAQSDNSTKQVRLGDRLPETFWAQNHTFYQNGKMSRQSLAAYQDKLIVLDFWATWCGSCMKKFPLADSLQKEYGNQIAIILVNAGNTRDTKEKIAPVMQRYKLPLPTILLDSTLTKMFPHAVIPHYVWIEQGQYRAASGTEFFTREGVAASIHRRKYLNQVEAKLKEQLK